MQTALQIRSRRLKRIGCPNLLTYAGADNGAPKNKKVSPRKTIVECHFKKLTFGLLLDATTPLYLQSYRKNVGRFAIVGSNLGSNVGVGTRSDDGTLTDYATKIRNSGPAVDKALGRHPGNLKEKEGLEIFCGLVDFHSPRVVCSMKTRPIFFTIHCSMQPIVAPQQIATTKNPFQPLCKNPWQSWLLVS